MKPHTHLALKYLLLMVVGLYMGSLLMYRSDSREQRQQPTFLPHKETPKHRVVPTLPTERLITGKLRRRLPDAIIIGVKKGGTRATIDFLNVNKYVHIAPTEVHFFDREERYKKGLKYYISKLPKVRDGEVLIEKTPNYIYYPAAARRIYKMKPNIKLILIVKDPVYRAISDYMHMRVYNKNKLETSHTFEEIAISKAGKINESYSPVYKGNYAKFLKNYLKYFNLSQIHIADGESLMQNPTKYINKIEKFLDIPMLVKEEDFVMSDEKNFYCINGSKVKCLNKFKGIKHQNVTQNAIDKLKEYYKPYSRTFFDLTGLSFDW